MNIYFELADCAVDQFGSKYLVQNDIADEGSLYVNVMRMSNRAWAEDSQGVRLIKNRFTGELSDPINDKEFFWIKLRSSAYNQRSQWKI